DSDLCISWYHIFRRAETDKMVRIKAYVGAWRPSHPTAPRGLPGGKQVTFDGSTALAACGTILAMVGAALAVALLYLWLHIYIISRFVLGRKLCTRVQIARHETS